MAIDISVAEHQVRGKMNPHINKADTDDVTIYRYKSHTNLGYELGVVKARLSKFLELMLSFISTTLAMYRKF